MFKLYHSSTDTPIGKNTAMPIQRIRGVSMVEFSLIALPFLLCVVLLIEKIVLQQTEHMVQYALTMASREGSLHHAEPEKILSAFEQHLFPLYAQSTAMQHQAHSRQQMEKIWLRSQQQYAYPYTVDLLIHRPNHRLFAQFGEKNIRMQNGQIAWGINNDYQNEQFQKKTTSTHSGLNIFQANILILEVYFAKAPMLPGVSLWLKAQAALLPHRPESQYWQKGVYAIRTVQSSPMHSHPIQFSNDYQTATSRISYHKNPAY